MADYFRYGWPRRFLTRFHNWLGNFLYQPNLEFAVDQVAMKAWLDEQLAHNADDGG